MMVHVHGIAYILLLFLQGSPAVLFRKNGRVVEGNALLTRQSPKAARRFESCFFRERVNPRTSFISNKGGTFISNEATAFISNQVF